MDDSFEGPAHVDWPRLQRDVQLGGNAFLVSRVDECSVFCLLIFAIFFEGFVRHKNFKNQKLAVKRFKDRVLG